MNKSTARTEILKNRHEGQDAIIVCNGPSLNRMDLSFLRNYPTIGLNKIFLGFKKFRFYPKYYVSVNRHVIEQSQHEIAALNCVKFISRQKSNGLIHEDGLTYLIDTQNPEHVFCDDLCKGLHEGYTVTYVALQIAYYLGFSKVFIIGMDHSFIYQGDPNQTNVMDGADPNHFVTDYFGFGKKWDNPDLENSERSYRLAREAYEADGREIFDATVDGLCNIFKKIDYRILIT